MSDSEAAHPSQHGLVVVSCLLHDRIDCFTLQVELHKLRMLLCSQANHARISQNIVSGRERATATDASRIVAVAHTTNECWNGQHNKDNQSTFRENEK